VKALAKGLQGLLGPRARAFRGLLENPGEAQARLLEELCARIRRTAYGRRHGVEGSGSFQRMPVVDYEALEPWILRERQGERCLLDRAPLGFEPTSGSRGPVKWIPVTRGLRSSFTSMFMLWAHDLLARGPGLGDGRLFASSTPGVADRPGAFQRDDDYLSPWLRPLLRPFLLWNPAGEGPPRTYLDRLAQGLLAAEDLEAMSVWSPSYLLVLMDHAQGAAGAVLEGLEGRVGSGRLGDLRRALAEGSWERVWPRLRLVSCWDGGQAKPLARRLAARLPHAWLQGKGLLATEAPLTFPSLAAGGFLPLLDQVYLELEDEAGLRPLAEAQVGRAFACLVAATTCTRAGAEPPFRHEVVS
jgi:hypothetical protein